MIFFLRTFPFLFLAHAHTHARVCVCKENLCVCDMHASTVCFHVCALLKYIHTNCVCAALPAGRIVIATTAITVTVGKKTAIAGGRMTIFI